MDVYDHQSYLESASNLAMLKLFHDEGADVSQFPIKVFMTSVHSPQGETLDIFFQGLRAFFEIVEWYEYGEELPEEYTFKKTACENLFVVRSVQFRTALNSPFRHVIEKKINTLLHQTMVDAEIYILEDGLAMDISYPFMMYPVVKNILDCKKLSEELIQKMMLEDENNHANPNHDYRSA